MHLLFLYFCERIHNLVKIVAGLVAIWFCPAPSAFDEW